MKIRLSEIPLAVAMTALVLALVIPAGARDGNKRRQKDKGSAASTPNTNICDITDRESKVHCYCENTQIPGNANKAECWVFNGGISKEDPIWPSFHTQHNLQTLSFNVRADGGLSFVPTRALRHLHQLQVLNIKYADIHEVTSHSFANLSSITEMSLTKNQIVTLKKYAFAHLLNLTMLTLDENRLTDIAKDAFFDLPVLQKLFLTNNSMTTINGGIFKALVNLMELEMDRNLLTTLSRESFDGLANLKRLDLRKNKLESLKDLTFAELWNLQELLLDYNALHSISERTFDGLSQLKRLSLSHNKITSLISGLFEGVRGLNSLDLRYNFLKTLTFENVRPIYDNLKITSSYLYLGGNDLTCDCRLQWMHSLRNETKSGKIRNSLEAIKCMLDETILMEKQNMNKYTHITDTNDLARSNKGPENEDEPDNFNDDDDETLQDSANVGNIATVRPNDRGQKRLLNVPIDLLPCPQAILKPPTESPFTYPSQNEVKDYRNIHMMSSSSGSELLTSFIPQAFVVLSIVVRYFVTM